MPLFSRILVPVESSFEGPNAAQILGRVLTLRSGRIADTEDCGDSVYALGAHKRGQTKPAAAPPSWLPSRPTD